MDEWELPPAPELRAVVPVADDLGIRDGVRTVVIAVEVWNDRLVVHCLHRPPLEAWRPGVAVDTLPTLTDEAGTAYELAGASMYGDGDVTRELVEFKPAPPSGVSALRFGIAGRSGIIAIVDISLEVEPATVDDD